MNEAEGLFNVQLPSPQFLQCRQSKKNLISFIAPTHVEENGHCTPHDLLFVLYLVFLEGRISSDVAAPDNTNTTNNVALLELEIKYVF